MFRKELPTTNITIASLTINITLSENNMTFEELKALIKTIASANDVSEVKAEVAELKTALQANADADAANTTGDNETKLTVAQHGELIEDLVNQLAAAPAPTEEPTA